MHQKGRNYSNGGIYGKASDLSEVVIVKVARKGLGIGLASFGTIRHADYGIYVKYIAKGSPAASHGKLRLKDVLLSINQVKLADKSVDDVYRLLRNLTPGSVSLIVKRTLGDNGATFKTIEQESKTKIPTPIIQSSLDLDRSLHYGCDKDTILSRLTKEEEQSTKKGKLLLLDEMTNSKESNCVQRNGLLNQVGLSSVSHGSSPGSSLDKRQRRKSLCTRKEIPIDMEAHSVEIVKEEKSSLGVSLVPATGKCLGLFLIRFIFPGTAAANNGNIFCGDCIFSVNGVKLYNLTHPQAIHILKKCTVKCKLILFREMKENSSRQSRKLKNKDEHALRNDFLPGTVTEKVTETNTTSVCNKVFKSKFLPEPGKKNNKKEELQLSDEEVTDGEPSRQEDVERVLRQCISTNKRSKLGPFIIEVEKNMKSLGIDVMIDEFGKCCITDVSPSGCVVNDKRIRVGDELIAINKQMVCGKPISDVKNSLRNIPNGLVQLILKDPRIGSDGSPRIKTNQKNTLSMVSNYNDDTVSNDDSSDRSERLSISSLVLPPDNSNIPLTVPALLCKNPTVSLRYDAGPMSVLTPDTKTIREDISDLFSLPPAPPRPVVSQKLLDSLQDSTVLSANKNTLDSVVNNTTPGHFISPFEQSDVHHDVEDNDSDLESMFSCIPAAPPPVGVSKEFQPPCKTISGSSLGEVFENKTGATESAANGFEVKPLIKKSYVETPLALCAKSVVNRNGSHNERRVSFDREADDQHDGRNTNVDGESTPSALDIKQILNSGGDPIQRLRNASFSSHESVSVYPEGIVVYNENKKKTLFSNLKSKLLLPSKVNAKDYKSQSNTDDISGNQKQGKDKKKHKQRPSSSLEITDFQNQSKGKKKKKQRPLSALDFSDESTRSTIKASISQPDLTNMNSHEVDFMFKNRESESPALRSVENWLTEPKNELPPSTGSQLPWKNSESSLQEVSSDDLRKTNDERKRGKSIRSYAPTVSPPHTPPPPPPSEFTCDDENNGNGACSNDDIPTSQIDIGYPEKLLSGYVPPREQFIGAKSMSESSSSIPGSYAAFGPSITSANVSVDNLDATYDVVDGKPLLNVTYEVNMDIKPEDVTYDVFANDQDTLSKSGNLTYNMFGNDQDSLSNNLGDGENMYESLDKYTIPTSTQLKVTTDHPTSILSEQQKQISEYHYPTGKQAPEEILPSPDMCPGSSPDNNTFNNHPPSYSHTRQVSELAEKDKLDPKLQPFIMTQGVSDLLGTWPGKPVNSKSCSSPNSDYDDDGWGSEFSSNVLDYSNTLDSSDHGLSQAKRYSVADVAHSFEEIATTMGAPSKYKDEYSPSVMTKPKGTDLRSFFSRGHKNGNHPTVEKRFGKKEKQNIMKSAVQSGKGGYIEPLPTKNNRYTFEKPQEVQGSGTNDKPVTKSNRKYSDDSLKCKTNPIAKPPRKKSTEDAIKRDNHEFNKSSNYETSEFVPSPVDTYATPGEGQVTLTPEEHNQLYASINYNAKINRRVPGNDAFPVTPLQDDSNPYATVNYNGATSPYSEEDNGYNSDGTVYSIPERNNSPLYSPGGNVLPASLPQVNEENGYAVINPISEETLHQENTHEEDRQKIFAVELMKEHGQCLGVSLIGGSDTPIVKNLIKSVDEGSIASKCRIPIKPGDEIIEVNGKAVIGHTHSQLLRVIREAPPLLQLQLHRSANGNLDLLKEQEMSENVTGNKIDSEKIIANLAASSHNRKGTEVVPLDVSTDQSGNENTADRLTVQTFELRKRSGIGLPPLGNKFPQINPPLLDHSTSNDITGNTPNRHGEPNFVKIIEIDLQKENGRGLGISVAGGPNHIIKTGIKVKRLSPNSIAYLDGRLQKDDHIVAINGKTIKGMTQGEALNMLQSIKTTVILTVHRSFVEHGESHYSEATNTVHQIDSHNHLDNTKSIQPVVSILKKYNSETCLPKPPKVRDENEDENGRKSRSRVKNTSQVRSQSETRELKRKPSTRSRSRSPGIFSRIFRGSNRSMKEDKNLKDQVATTTKDSEVEGQSDATANESNQTALPNYPFTLYFEKSSSSLDFTLTRGGKMYGDSHTIVQSIRKGSILSNSLFMGDAILSINGVSIQDFSDTELKKFLRNLPKGIIPMVAQRR